MITANLYLEHPKLALSPTIESVGDVEIDVVSEAGTDPEHTGSFFRILSADYDAVEAALERDDTVADYSLSDSSGRRRTYRIDYSDEALLVSPLLADIDGITLAAATHSDGWLIELQLPDGGALFEFSTYAEEHGVRVEPIEIRQSAEADYFSDFGLTGPQVEALACAYANGYYDEPRTATLAELGSILGISQTAVSGRLKRASASLIEATLTDAASR